MTGGQTARADAIPRIGARVPGWAFRVAVVVVGVALCFAQLPSGFWFGVGIALTVLAACFPRLPVAWALLILCGACVFLHPVGPQHGTILDWRTAALIAGAHLVHVLASYAAVIPITARVAVRALRGSALRFLVIQLPVQILGAVLLFVVAGATLPRIPSAGVIAAGALAAVALLLTAALLRDTRRS